MLENVSVTLQITDKAKEAIIQRMDSSKLISPVPGLIWGKWSDEDEYCWQIGFYEKNDIREGWLFEASTMLFYTYQDWLFEQLKGGTLDIVNGRIVIRYDDGTEAPREVPYMGPPH